VCYCDSCSITVSDVFHMRVHIGYRSSPGGHETQGPFVVRKVLKVIRHKSFSFERLVHIYIIILIASIELLVYNGTSILKKPEITLLLLAHLSGKRRSNSNSRQTSPIHRRRPPCMSLSFFDPALWGGCRGL